MEEIFNIASKRISGVVLTQEENQLLIDWLSSAENQLLYTELENVWKLTGKLSFEINPNVEAEWDAFKKLIPDTKVKFLSRKLVYSFSAIAASVILFLGIWGTSQFISTKDMQYYSGNSIKEIELVDHTKVFLNKNSQLTINRNYNTKNRTVTLIGEAYFEVSENLEVPFVVNTKNGIQAKVLGTHFNLKANANSDEFTLNVLSGKVLFGKAKTEKAIMVLKGQKATFDIRHNKVSQPSELNANTLSWKTKNYLFDNTPINEVAVTLEEPIGKKVILPANSELIRYSGSFTEPSDKQIAEVIALAMGWDYSITNDAVVFSEKK